jgi:hypothetical protein
VFHELEFVGAMKSGKMREGPVLFSFSNVPAEASAACASRGRDVRTTEADMVRGRSASWSSSSGIGASSVDAVLKGRRGLDILCCVCVVGSFG